MFRTPKRTKAQLNPGEMSLSTPPSKGFKMKTPDSSPAVAAVLVPGGVFSPSTLSTLSPTETKRGRPRAEVLNTLILQGSTSPSSIKCNFCNRVFPREKSLQAHRRTHTGEKPYACDFPRCTKRFAQSGQLKTHQRLHTGEKPFVCAAPNCDKRFTHANRHCPEHPDLTLKRFNSSSSISIENIDDEQYKKEIQKWMDSVKRRERIPSTCSTPKKSRTYKDSWLYQTYEEQNENINTENQPPTPNTPKGTKVRSSQELTYGLSDYMKQNSLDITPPLEETRVDDKIPYVAEEVEVITSPVSTRQTELPKKRWLREATLEQRNQQRWDQDLASPINWGEEANIIEYENQKRPTVLVKIGSAPNEPSSLQSTPMDSSDMQIAMALVELGNIPKQTVNYSF